MFIIGEEAGMCNRNRSYDLKILEACLSLSHIVCQPYMFVVFVVSIDGFFFLFFVFCRPSLIPLE